MKKIFVLLVLGMFAISTSLLAQTWPPANLVYQVQGQQNVLLSWDAPQNPNDIILHYDNGENDDSIGTGGAADFDVAIRFTPTQLASYNGYYLTSIDFFPAQAACSYSIRVWQGANAATMLVDQPVSNPTINAWNNVALTTPVVINASQELWFGYRANTTTGHPAGCDAGPAVAGFGDMIFFGGSWASMYQAYGLNYNWNIQGHLSIPGKDVITATPIATFDYVINNSLGKDNNPFKRGNTGGSSSTSLSRPLVGYKVYRNGTLIANNITPTNYSDMGLADGTYNYYVTAMYTEGESDPTNTVTVVIQAGNLQTLLSENFSGGTIPATWTATTSSAQGWFVTTNGSSQYWTIPAGNGHYACSNDDGANDNGSVDYLITPVLDFSNLNAATLTYRSFFTGAYSQTAHLRISINGAAWTLLQNVTSATAWTDKEVDLTAYTGTGFSNVRINFHSNDNGAWASGWAIDDVLILGNLAGPPQYGTLSGTVYDQNQVPLVGATIQAGNYNATTGAGGSYQIAQIPVGTYNVTASMTGYSPYTAQGVVIALDQTTTVNFYLEVFIEDLLPPRNLEYTVNGSNVTLNWLAPSGGNAGDELEEGFEGGAVPAGWLAIDANNDGYNWFAYEYSPHSGAWSMASASWWQNVVINPNNFLVTPQLTLGDSSELRFWAAAQDPAYPADHYKVKLSTTGTTPANFNVVLFQETLSSATWHEVVVDLSAYTGQSVYIAWHHVDCSDEFVMKIDDISVMNTATREILFAADFEDAADFAKFNNPSRKFDRTRDLLGYNIYRNGALIGNTANLTYTNNNVPNGTYTYSVTAVYDEGESNSISATVVVNNVDAPENVISFVTALEGNYPNPFNPTTTIQFATSESGHVTIDVYNVKGQKVTTLVDERMEPGNHSIVWNGKDENGRDASSGIYFSKMRSGRFTSTKKMILMK